MIPLMNAFACLLALAVTVFYWRSPLRIFKETAIIVGSLALFCVYSYFAGDMTDPQMQHYPFRMLALALCFSTTALPNKRRRYQGVDMPWTRILALSVSVLGSTFLSRISHEMEFALMAYWIAVWVFF